MPAIRDVFVNEYRVFYSTVYFGDPAKNNFFIRPSSVISFFDTDIGTPGCNMQERHFQRGTSFKVGAIGVRIHLDGDRSEELIRDMLRSGIIKFYVDQKPSFDFPLGVLYPPGLGYSAEQTKTSLLNEHEGATPYRSSVLKNNPPYEPLILPALPSMSLTKEASEDLDELGRPPWYRGGFCRFLALGRSITIAHFSSFHFEASFSGPYDKDLILADVNESLRGEFVIYIVGIFKRPV